MYLAGVSSRLLLYDTNNWDLRKSYGCYDGILRDISWSDDSKYLLQVNAKGIVEILSAADHDVRSLQHIPLKDTWSASFHRDGHRNIAIGTRSGNVLIWDTKNKNITKTFPSPAQQSSVNHISFNAKNTSLAASSHNGDTVIYGLVSNIPVLTIKLPYSKSISAMKFHHESRSLIGLATYEGHIVLRDITTNKDKALFENVHASPVSDFTYSLVNKDVMLSSGFDKIAHIYDVRLQNIVSTIRTTHTLTSLTMNPDNLVAFGTKDGTILVYDLRDLANPFQVLRGHSEEVRKVAFQPNKKKQMSADISIKEDNEMISTPNKQSPTKNNTMELFNITDSSLKNNINVTPNPMDNKADSFLVMVGLDKSNDMFHDEVSPSSVFDKISDKHELRYNQLDAERNINKSSTPFTNKTADKIVLSSSPICPSNEIPDNGAYNGLIVNQPTSQTNQLDAKAMEELKDFIKLTIADVADDNRNYFLHMMMVLTKDKIFLEKQLRAVNSQMERLVEGQTALMEVNRKLALEIDYLKHHRSSL